MGFFGSYVFTSNGWHEWDPDQHPEPSVVAPWLSVSIHDSDIATISYQPAGEGSGTAYLGTTPRTYFEDDSASAPTDIPRESRALAAWRLALPNPPHGDAHDLSDVLRSYLAADGTDAESEADDDAEEADADIFVEIKTAQFLVTLRLPLPQDLRDLE